MIYLVTSFEKLLDVVLVILVKGLKMIMVKGLKMILIKTVKVVKVEVKVELIGDHTVMINFHIYRIIKLVYGIRFGVYRIS